MGKMLSHFLEFFKTKTPFPRIFPCAINPLKIFQNALPVLWDSWVDLVHSGVLGHEEALSPVHRLART